MPRAASARSRSAKAMPPEVQRVSWRLPEKAAAVPMRAAVRASVAIR
jgi:hypothetical protein